MPGGSDKFFDRKVHFTSERFFSATVTLPTHFTVNSFEGKEKECLMQTHVMEMSVQSILKLKLAAKLCAMKCTITKIFMFNNGPLKT